MAERPLVWRVKYYRRQVRHAIASAFSIPFDPRLDFRLDFLREYTKNSYDLILTPLRLEVSHDNY